MGSTRHGWCKKLMAKDKAFKALNGLLRYKARIERERRMAMAALDTLRQRRLTRSDEPEPAATKADIVETPVRSEPEPGPNRHQGRALKAIARQRGRLAA